MKSTFEEMGGTYTLGADGMYYPGLEAPGRQPARFGKYGRMRKVYLKEHRPVLYHDLILNGKLVTHLNEVDDTANARLELLIGQLKQQRHITEALKARDMMGWVQEMNAIQHTAEELMLDELMYV
ncbi:hypothetical protein P261_02522 [Lachnospiraceae bacterium TWA4]|nr:hypothetical protein P261_02522 [Lachnospiraceae bacterium TWA4]